MTETIKVNSEMVQQWIEKRLDSESVRRELISRGLDSATIESHLKEYRKLKDAKKRTLGFILLAAGAVMGFISCVLTILNIVPSLHDFFLYGLTSVSAVILCVGLYLVFE